jgi:NAD-dependent dihydropyrimidine dehydrogenase PreA subunit
LTGKLHRIAGVWPGRFQHKGGFSVAYIICEPCIGVKDAACVAVCPVDCIYEGDDQYYINPDECIDCGACEPECPVSAIFTEDAVPDQWESYIQKNANFFG